MIEKEEIIKEIDRVTKVYNGYIIDYVGKRQCLTIKTILILEIFQRALSIIDAFKDTIEKNNILIINALIRMQIDNCIFAYGIYLLHLEGIKLNNFYFDLSNNGKELRDYKTSSGKLFDATIVKKINDFMPKFEDLYQFTNKNIHFSNKANAFTLQINSNLELLASVSTDYSRFENDSIVSGRTMIEVSKLVNLIIVEYWKDIEDGMIIAK